MVKESGAKGQKVKEPSMEQTPFKVGDYVVYPSHGVGKMVGIEDHEICGTTVQLFVIEFSKDHMTLKLPVKKACASGLRPVSNSEDMESVVASLSSRIKKKKALWSRRAQEYESKINSGSIESLAEVIRELHTCQSMGEQSYSERQIYQTAFDRFVREFAIVAQIGEEEAVEIIQSKLSAA